MLILPEPTLSLAPVLLEARNDTLSLWLANWMEGGDTRNRADPGQLRPGRGTRDSSTQTDSKVQGEPDGKRVLL